jgi:DNA mismatch repair protein MutS
VSADLGRALQPMMVPLFRDLAEILEKAARPIARALKQYVGLSSSFLADLRHELPFYLGAERLIRRAREHGLPMCRPEIAPEDERACWAQDGYNMALAVQLGAGSEDGEMSGVVVTNDIAFGPEGRIFVLTGPNQGGKTTYIQGIGLTQVMAQAGLYVPGTQARISPADGIYTHFPVEEKLDRGTGRFGDEAKRLHAIFTHVTPYSLVLLNETLSGTSAGESLYLGQDMLRLLRLVGARPIFSTHLHELAAGVDELNASEPGDSRVASLVASPITPDEGAAEDPGGEVRRSFKIAAGPPLGRSYAREIAMRYGVSYEQLRALLRERGVVPPTNLESE